MKFKEEYKSAYDNIKADKDSLEKIKRKAETEQRNYRLKPSVIIATFMIGLVLYAGVPVLADEIAKVLNLYELGIVDYTMYKHIQRQYPEWVNALHFVPVNVSDSKNGVKMTVEAIGIEKRTAIVYVSFANEEGYDFINADREYEGFDIDLNTTTGQTEGIERKELGYDEETEKLYVVYAVTSSTQAAYTDEELTFFIRGLSTREKRPGELDLQNVETQPKEKKVQLYGTEVKSEMVEIEGDVYPCYANVLDMMEFEDSMKDTVTITGVAYTDGMLRVQVCNGVNMVGKEAFRSCRFFCKGEERELLQTDESLYWYENRNGELVEFVEYYFAMEEGEWNNLGISTEYYEDEGYFHTTWSVTFEVE